MKILPGKNSEPSGRTTVVVCVNQRLGPMSTSCGGSGSQAIADKLEAGIAERGLNAEVDRIICLGMCAEGPNVRLIPAGTWFTGVAVDDAEAILDQVT